jgi:glycerol kinase
MPDFILALDQGTTSSRAILFDAAGRVQGVEQQEYEQHYPVPGWVEHAPEDIWTSQAGVVAKLLRAQSLTPFDIAAIGITNQRETTILWERKTGRPVANAIVWQDRRTAPLCDELRAAGHEALFRARTGLPLDPYFSGTKIRWLLDNTPDLRLRAERGEIAFGTVDTFLLWRLSGGAIHATDVSNASRTLLFNIVTREWDNELLALLAIPRALLPDVLPSSHVYGETIPSLFGGAIPIAGVAGDQQAATFGQACHRQGMVKNTYGTGSFLLMNVGDKPQFSRHGLLTTIAWELEDGTRRKIQNTRVKAQDINEEEKNKEEKEEADQNPKSKIQNHLAYALEGSVFVTGAAVQWLRDELQIIRSAGEIEALAASVPDNGGVYFVPAFTGLGAPYWDPYARGGIVGLTRGTGRAHLARATLEAVCYQTRDVLEAMRADSGLDIAQLRVDGGMTVNNALLQLQADILGTSVVRPAVRETTALGAAYLAGLAVGFWHSAEEIAAQWAADVTFAPQMSLDQRESLYAGWKQAVRRVQ